MNKQKPQNKPKPQQKKKQRHDPYAHIPDHIKKNWGSSSGDKSLEHYYRMTQKSDK